MAALLFQSRSAPYLLRRESSFFPVRHRLADLNLRPLSLSPDRLMSTATGDLPTPESAAAPTNPPRLKVTHSCDLSHLDLLFPAHRWYPLQGCHHASPFCCRPSDSCPRIHVVLSLRVGDREYLLDILGPLGGSQKVQQHLSQVIFSRSLESKTHADH